nr:4'-phosphopantetheinyl transferase superfamily protein [Brevibacillus thermoruber]
MERIVRMDLHIADHLFTPQENRILASKTGDARLAYFFHVWTLKESYVKAVGKGLSIPLDSFSVVCANEKEWYSPEADGFHFTSVRLDREHILSACSYMAALRDHIQHVSLSTCTKPSCSEMQNSRIAWATGCSLCICCVHTENPVILPCERTVLRSA